MENIIFLIMILIFIFQGIANILKKQKEKQSQQPIPQEEESYEVLPPREEEPIPVPEETIPPLTEEWQEELPEVKVEEPEKVAEKIVSIEPAVPYEIEKFIKIRYMAGLTTEKLKDGIILSTILGPPKAYKFMGRG